MITDWTDSAVIPHNLLMIDRCGRVGMMMALCVFYPQYLFVLQLLVCLAIAVGVSVHYRYIEHAVVGIANGVLGCS